VSDPTGKRALFEAAAGLGAPVSRPIVDGRASGKAALFSSPPRRPGTVIIECSSCRNRSRVSLAEVARRFMTGSAWVPLLRPAHPHWLRCPGCERWRWCRIGWTE
jgi:hypothetical protein